MEYAYRNKVNIIPSYLDFILTHKIKWDPVGGYFNYRVSARPSHLTESEEIIFLEEDGVSRSRHSVVDLNIRKGTLKSKKLILSMILEKTKEAVSEVYKEIKEFNGR